MLVRPLAVERGGAADDDEKHDDHAGDAADEHVQARVLVLARADALFDEARLQIEKLPGRDGGADQGREHQQIVGVEMQRGKDGFLGGQQPVGLGENGGNDVGQIETRRRPEISSPPGDSCRARPAARRRWRRSARKCIC